MKKAIAWEIDAEGKPKRLEASSIPLEQHLEDWIEVDVDIAADDVLLIGRQVPTSYGTWLDLLGIDSQGDLVIIELKRNQTLRETVAQGLEYAAWASSLGYDAVVQLATERFGSLEVFEADFVSRFGTSLPDALNNRQRILLVAPEVTDATARVVEYLAETYGVPINAVSFDVLAVGGRPLLIRQLVIADEHPAPAPGTSKRRPPRTLDEFLVLAEANGVRPLVERLLTMRDFLPSLETFTLSFTLRTKTPDKRLLAAFSIYPTAETNPNEVVLNVSVDNLMRLFVKTRQEADEFVNSLFEYGSQLPSWEGWHRVGFRSLDQVEKFDARLRAFAGVERSTTVES